jgi:hypothetical protein
LITVVFHDGRLPQNPSKKHRQKRRIGYVNHIRFVDQPRQMEHSRPPDDPEGQRRIIHPVGCCLGYDCHFGGFNFGPNSVGETPRQ